MAKAELSKFWFILPLSNIFVPFTDKNVLFLAFGIKLP